MQKNVLLYTHRGQTPDIDLEATKMTTNEILDVLAENESKLFYAHCHDPKNENLEKAWKAAKASLEAFYENAKAMGEI
jgi:transposase